MLSCQVMGSLDGENLAHWQLVLIGWMAVTL